MENHPIPQDVTSFQFKIIGNMTIKQFAYMASGSILAYLFFSLPIFFLIKFLLVAFFFLLGIFLAFIPVSGRPLDMMLSHFVKALFVPNQYVYQKTDTAKALPPSRALPSTNHQPQQIPVGEKQEADLKKEAGLLEKEIAAAKKSEGKQQSGSPKDEAHQKTLLLEQQLQQVLAQKQQLEQQLLDLTRKFEMQKQKNPRLSQKPTVPQIAKGMLSTDSPNLINGVVKDPRGNIISNILVEVKDQEGNPIRAFKTNSLGQFASATPVVNGSYILTFEDPRNIHKFANIEVVAKGEVISPIEITSIDPREELRKELFNT